MLKKILSGLILLGYVAFGFSVSDFVGALGEPMKLSATDTFYYNAHRQAGDTLWGFLDIGVGGIGLVPISIIFNNDDEMLISFSFTENNFKDITLSDNNTKQSSFFGKSKYKEAIVNGKIIYSYEFKLTKNRIIEFPKLKIIKVWNWKKINHTIIFNRNMVDNLLSIYYNYKYN